MRPAGGVFCFSFLILLVAASACNAQVLGDPVSDTPRPLTPDERRKERREASLQVSDTTWIYVPIVVCLVFGLALVAHVKFSRLEGLSLRLWLLKFVCLEALYNTLAGADHHKIIEERNIEIGHQVFHFLAWLLLLINFVLNSDGLRWMFYVLAVTQIGLWGFQLIIDNILIWKGGIRSVRSVNTKLRFAQCTYQVVLFCTDVISGGIVQLPVDCYIWATAHFSFEGVGLVLEGLNVIGMGELAIATIVNARAVQAADGSPGGAVCAFGVTSLVVSCVSIFGGILFKLNDSKKYIAGAAQRHHHSHTEQEEEPPLSPSTNDLPGAVSLADSLGGNSTSAPSTHAVPEPKSKPSTSKPAASSSNEVTPLVRQAADTLP